MRKRIFKIVLFFFSGLAALGLGLFIYLLIVAKIDPPKPDNMDCLALERTQLDSSLFVLNNSWLRKSESGLYEMYVEGKPFERGVVIGKLTRELAQYQEQVFNEQIHQLVPSEFKLGALKYFVAWFNRHLNDNVPEEFKLEVYGLSTEASHQYDYIASPYQRILNYHAAHDIGHALQNMSLVGCTSFAAWDKKTDDGKLIVARNFDFYVSDEFAKNKIIAFYKPEQGHRFMMITFGGMVGALSGMNDQGLTVTINAAKSDIPSSSAMPVSLVAREILQYAATIEEAYTIAKKRKMFVSESFLIGSAKDGKAAIIEKTPMTTELVETSDDLIICTNHFQGKSLGSTPLNREHIRTSASMYRWKRVEEIIKSLEKISVKETVTVLRDRRGLQGADIGLGNEKSINQLIAHHSVIFQPEQRKVWVSTFPWQLGKYVCYDLNAVFNMKLKNDQEIYDSTFTFAPDSFLLTKSFHDFSKFTKYRFPFQPRNDILPDSLIKWNPNSYLAYLLAGDASFKKNDFKSAGNFYRIGLTKEIATLQERDHMVSRLNECKRRLE